METLTNLAMGSIVVSAALGLSAFIICLIVAGSPEMKVRYKEGQLQIKASGEWICYDDHIDYRINTLKGDLIRKLVKECEDIESEQRSLLAKIHANHRPDWEYLTICKTKPIVLNITMPFNTITLRCKKCGYDKKFTEKELPVVMRNALIKLGLLTEPEKQIKESEA